MRFRPSFTKKTLIKYLRKIPMTGSQSQCDALSDYEGLKQKLKNYRIFV